MLTNKQFVAVAATLFAQGALALNVNRHGHGHNHVHKRDDVYTEWDVVVVTDWSTVTVSVDGSVTTTSTPVYTTTTSSFVVTTPPTPTPTPSSTTEITTSSTPTTSEAAATSSAAGHNADAIVDVSASVGISAAAAAVATASSSSSSSSGARGLAYNDGSLLDIFLSSGTKCGWSYNWGYTAATDAPSDLEYVPMLWSPATEKVSGWDAAAAAAIKAGSKYFLGFNECDNSGQCNMDAASAATAHQTYMNPYSGQVKIGTPAITNSASSGEGIDWLNAFLDSCNGNCNYDFCPFHWYNLPDVDEFLQHASNVYAACGKEVWITEFAPISGTTDEINSFLQEVLNQLENNSTYSFVTRYAYFWVSTSSLLSDTTTLSTYGETFAYY